MATKRKSFNLLGRRAQNKLIKSELQMSCNAKIVRRDFKECEANDSIDTKTRGSGVSNDIVPPSPGSATSDSDNLMSSCSTLLPDFVGIGNDDAGNVDTTNVSDEDEGSVLEECAGNDGIGVSEVKRAIRGWAIKHNITHSALNELLFELRKVESLSSLPLDARTLLKTSVSAELRLVAPGSYFHFGLKKGIMNAVKRLEVNPVEIKVLIGIDGFPVAKSSKSQFWPILAHLVPIQNSCVFPVGIYHGYEKPGNANDFLRDFVDEAIDLLETGVKMADSSIIPVELLGICCDAPAKSFVLCVKGHTGYSSCTRCTIEGKFVNNRVCFPGKSGVKRTHASFIGQVDEDYRRGMSILTEIPDLDLVYSFSLDYMHLICLGVMHKLINIWLSGRIPRRFPSRQNQKLSEKLLSLRSSIPFEFARRPRGMEEVSRWKATEFRQFLLYTGPVVLSKSGIDGDILLNFMSLHAAMRILLDKQSVPSRVMYAQSLLEHFHSSFGIVYGEDLISHNVHNVLHLADDFHRFGALDSCSAFRFENHMQKLKRLMRSPNKPLEQVIRRYSELTNNEIEEGRKLNHNFPYYSTVHYEGPLLSNCCITKQYKEVSFQGFRLSTSKPNNVCGLSSGDILVVDNIVYCLKSKEMIVVGRTYQDKDDFYSLPCESSKLGIYKVDNLSKLQCFPVRNIILKITMWIVVHFLEENSVEVVQISWYSGGNCRWPDAKGVERLRGMVEKEVEPQDSWFTFKAKAVGQRMYCSLQKAREKCSLAEDTSDLTSDAEKGVGKRKRVAVRWSSDSEEEEQGTSSSPGIPMPPKLVEHSDAQPAPLPVANSASSSDTPCGSCCKRSSFEEELMRAVTFIKHSVVDINKRLRALEAPATVSEHEAEVSSTVLGLYPIATHIQLLEEEKKLLDGAYKQQLTSELRIIGGNSPKDMARRILRALVTDSVAAEYSWLGQKKKKVFSKLLLKDVIFDVFRKSKWSGTTNKDIETFVKDWLRHAKFRSGGNEKSLSSDVPVNNTDVPVNNADVPVNNADVPVNNADV